MSHELNFYHIEKCEICAGTGIIHIDPWAEFPLPQNLLEDLDDVECPHCDGKGELKVYMRLKGGRDE